MADIKNENNNIELTSNDIRDSGFNHLLARPIPMDSDYKSKGWFGKAVESDSVRIQDGNLILSDGKNIRLILDSKTGAIRSSKAGYDATIAGSENLSFSSISLNPPDWMVFTQLRFKYSSSTRITVDGGIPDNYFSIGDKVKLKQTTYKYFYIVNVNVASIDVYAGDDYVVANEDITEFGISKLQNPTGHPIIFTRAVPSADITSSDGAINDLSGTQTLYMIGKYVFVNSLILFDVTGEVTFLKVKHPILRTSETSYIFSNDFFATGFDSFYRHPAHGTFVITAGNADYAWIESLVTIAGYTVNKWNILDGQSVSYNYFYGIKNQ